MTTALYQEFEADTGFKGSTTWRIPVFDNA